MGRKTVEILARRLAFGAGCAPRTGAHGVGNDSAVVMSPGYSGDAR
jgi:hypothetical protein